MNRSILTFFRRPSQRLRSLQRNYISLDDMLFGEPGFSNPTSTSASKAAKLPLYPTTKLVKGKYMSPWSKETNKTLWDVIRMLLSEKKPPLKFSKPVDKLDLIKCIPVDRQKMRSTTAPHMSWFGHASCYYQSNDIFFLTDPVWGERASPLTFAGPKRHISPPIDLEDLRIDVVLLSHTHYDHMCTHSVKRIGNRAHWVVPMGVKKLLNNLGVTNCTELEWWQTYHHLTPKGDTAEIIFAPTKHWTSRTPFDRNTCLWGSFIVKTSQAKFFFTGDTAYCDLFKLIGENFGPFDMSAIPIGAYSPRWFMKDVHCDPSEAAQIHVDLRSKKSAAIHWGTFPMTGEDIIEPALELARARDSKGLSKEEIFTMAPGETLLLTESPQHDLATKRMDLYGEFLTQHRELQEV